MKHTYVVTESGNKKRLIYVQNIDDGHLVGFDHLTAPDMETVTVSVSEVVAQLGAQPKVGQCYGIHVEPYWRSLDHADAGTVHLFRRITKDEWKGLRGQLSRAYKLLDRHGLRPTHPISWRIRHRKGAYDGTYKAVVSKGEDPEDDIITFMPRTFSTDPNDKQTVWLLCHELGHGIWFRRMKGRDRAAWVKAYVKATTMHDLRVARIQEIAKVIKENRPQSLRELWGLFDFDDDEDSVKQVDVQLCLNHIMSNHNLKPAHLDMLLGAGVDITEKFSRHPLDTGELGELLTEYSRKAPEEMFAEAFALWVTGHKIPEKWVKLLERTTR